VDLKARIIETAPIDTIRFPAMDAVGQAALGVVTQASPEPSRAERFSAGPLPHPYALEGAK
jgi:hypothetical protein